MRCAGLTASAGTVTLAIASLLRFALFCLLGLLDMLSALGLVYLPGGLLYLMLLPSLIYLLALLGLCALLARFD